VHFIDHTSEQVRAHDSERRTRAPRESATEEKGNLDSRDTIRLLLACSWSCIRPVSKSSSWRPPPALAAGGRQPPLIRTVGTAGQQYTSSPARVRSVRASRLSVEDLPPLGPPVSTSR
jgi:hypothetical protein